MDDIFVNICLLFYEFCVLVYPDDINFSVLIFNDFIYRYFFMENCGNCLLGG
jgi:hypothetical protein